MKVFLMSAASLTVSACASGGGVPKVESIRPMHGSTMEEQVAQDFAAGRPAIRRVRLSGDFFALKPLGGEIPQSIKDAKVRIDFGGQQPVFDDLLMLLEDRGLSVILGWDDGSYVGDSGNSRTVSVSSESSRDADDGSSKVEVERKEETSGDQGSSQSSLYGNDSAGKTPSLRNRPLPFRRYEGTLGGLFRQIERSMGVTLWWEEGIYVSPVGRYSVMLPQNKELMQQVVNELKAKGANNVVASLQAGTVSFVAPGALAEKTIRPYLTRLGRNASEVTMQVALVSVVMNETTSKGFDWSQFNFSFGAPPESSTGTGTTPGAGNGGSPGDFLSGGTNNGGTGTQLPKGSLFTLGNDAFRIFNPAASILGSTRPLDITGAIKFLSQYGDTAVDQNVELRTLAGTAVNWRSGETIPYVSGVSATTSGFNNGGTNGGLAGAIGSAQTEKLETGLTLKLAPNYEAAGGLVTVSFDLELTELIEFIELNAGNQLGSFTQPRTREQKLDDIVRVPVGETIVLGGLRRQLASTDRNGPFSLYSLGAKNRKNETQTIFIILRPTVTVYEVAGLEHGLPSKSNEVLIGNDGQPWSRPEGDYRGTNMFGARVDKIGPDRRRSMAQPEISDE
jgi:type II secretory pathway component GspD/PulD (secretin)